MPSSPKSKENFCCAKCRNREAISREGTLPAGSFADLLGLKAGSRYLFVTCTLCGYTELYDLAVVARAAAVEAPKRAEAGARQEA